MNTKPGIVTPFSLQFGLLPESHSQITLEDSLQNEDKGAFKAKWQHILQQHDKMLQAELDEKIESFKRSDIEEGDLVLISNEVRHKEQLRFYKEIFEVIRIQKAKYYCAPLFKNVGLKQPLFEVNGDRIKKYNYSALFDVLPSKVRRLMGENLSPEQLKLQAETNSKLPADLHDWRQYRSPNIIKLRNRITPSEKLSEPAMSVVDSDILDTHSRSSKSSDLSIPDSIPDSVSAISSIFKTNKQTVNQLQTTDKGLFSINDYVHSPRQRKFRRLVAQQPSKKPTKDKDNEKKPVQMKPDFGNITPIVKNKPVQVIKPSTPVVKKAPDKLKQTKDDTLGATTIVNDMVKDLVDQLKQPVDGYLNSDPARTPLKDILKDRLKEKKKGTIFDDSVQLTRPLPDFSEMRRKLRDRIKILRPQKYRDPNFTK